MQEKREFTDGGWYQTYGWLRWVPSLMRKGGGGGEGYCWEKRLSEKETTGVNRTIHAYRPKSN